MSNQPPVISSDKGPVLAGPSAERYKAFIENIDDGVYEVDLQGNFTYFNKALCTVFGYPQEDIQGRNFSKFMDEERARAAFDIFNKIYRTGKGISDLLWETIDKEGNHRKVELSANLITDHHGEKIGFRGIARDVTEKIKLARIREAMLHISMALPTYPDLEDLLDYVSGEVRRVLNVEGSLVILLDQEKRELFFLGAAYPDKVTEQKAKEIRFPADKGISGKVIKTGEPIIVHDTSKDPDYYGVVDQRLGYNSRSMLDVPMRSGDRTVGVLSAINKKEGFFNEEDVEILTMIGATVAPSIENARFSMEIKRAYREVSSLNRAKDRMINRLSHEMKTPVSVLLASLNILTRRLTDLPEATWKPTIERARRNLDRLLGIQYQVEDIMEGRPYRNHEILNLLLDQCEDQLQGFVAEKVGEGPIVESIRQRISEVYGPREATASKISLQDFVKERIKALLPLFSHREVEVATNLKPAPRICVPVDVLQKVVDGLVRNAVEATPDEGKIELVVQEKGSGAELVVMDCGIGITEENQCRLFEGFFTTQETMAYSSKRPFEFGAGGKGADLLRMKIFAERYGFQITMSSSRCPSLPRDGDLCAGRISLCRFCTEKGDCEGSGGTSFFVYFPAAPEHGCGKDSNTRSTKSEIPGPDRPARSRELS